ncbi:YfhO family protein [Ligilactobacillus sp. LYQ112]|uniref:YfhO family protein n=1 Tax=Ligilactobacillus sp. LYQ112 TaxID=3391060 RepID=UPI00398384FD
MREKITQFLRRHRARIVDFILPVVVMLTCMIALRMTPFGPNTLLTYDMQEQYVKFYAFFRTTFLHPTQFLYFFGKGLGGETIGMWAYYLLSPFNLVLLFFNNRLLPLGIMIVMLLKQGCAAMALGAWLDQQHHVDAPWRIMLTLGYALMGWTLANELNLMWVDVLIALPFVLWGLERIYDDHKVLPFSLALAALFFVNFYMGYMVVLFSVLYFCWLAIQRWVSWQEFGHAVLRYVGGGLLSGALTAFLLLPTQADIAQSKGQFMVTQLPLNFDYTPWHMISKFMMGALNDAQIQAGIPNLFIPTLLLVLVVEYFLMKQIPIRERIASGCILAFMLFSVCYAPLDLAWHLFQPPVFYSYRFSYLVSFWLLFLAARALMHVRDIQGWQIGTGFGIVGAIVGIVWLNLRQFDFLDKPKMITTAFFVGSSLVLILLMRFVVPAQRKTLLRVLLLVTIVQVGANAYMTIRFFGWEPVKTYQRFVKIMGENSSFYTDNDQPYRLETTFDDGSENNSFQFGYKTVSDFSSTQRATVTNFMNDLGQPTYTGKVVYQEGNIVTDSLLGVKYYLAPANQFHNLITQVLPADSYRPDFKQYRIVAKNGMVERYENPYVLPMAFAASQQIMQPFSPNQATATTNIETVMQRLDNKPVDGLFIPVRYAGVLQQSLLVGGKNGLLTPDGDNSSGGAAYNITLRLKTNDPYYVQLGSNLLGTATVLINGVQIPAVGNLTEPLLQCVGASQKGHKVVISIQPQGNQNVPLDSVQIYRLNVKKAERRLQGLQHNGLQDATVKGLHLRGIITTTAHKSVIMTTIPYNEGWHAYVDGKRVPVHQALGTFVALKVTPGKHRLVLSFWPPLLNVGLLISLLAWSSLAGWTYCRYHRFSRKRKQSTSMLE